MYIEIFSRENLSVFVPVVRSVKNNLLHKLAACKTQQCKQVLNDYNVNQMSVQVDFDKVFFFFLLSLTFVRRRHVDYWFNSLSPLHAFSTWTDTSRRYDFIANQNCTRSGFPRIVVIDFISASIRYTTLLLWPYFAYDILYNLMGGERWILSNVFDLLVFESLIDRVVGQWKWGILINQLCTTCYINITNNRPIGLRTELLYKFIWFHAYHNSFSQ